MNNLRRIIRKILKEDISEDIKNSNIKTIANNLKYSDQGGTVANYIHGIFDVYVREVGIETIFNFLKREDGTNWHLSVGNMEPGTPVFKDNEPNPTADEIQKIIQRNKIPYTKEQISGRLVQYFIRRLRANIPEDMEFKDGQDVLDFIKMYREKFLYGYLIPISKI